MKQVLVYLLARFVSAPVESLAIMFFSIIMGGMLVMAANTGIHQMYLEWHPEAAQPPPAHSATFGISVKVGSRSDAGNQP